MRMANVSNRENQCVLHVGGHRTGTTRLQELMYRRRAEATKLGMRFIEISETRKGGFLSGCIFNQEKAGQNLSGSQARIASSLNASLSEGKRIFLSDENILGTMEKCVADAQLYPDVEKNLRRLGASLDLFDCVFLSVRSQDEWWSSVLAFLAQRDYPLPNLDSLAASICNSRRGWADVVRDVKEVMPKANLVIRDFQFQKENPKRQLRDASLWNDIKFLQNIPNHRANNSDKGRKLLRLMAEKRGAESIFSSDQISRLKEAYISDLNALRRLSADPKVRFLQ